MKSRPRIDQLLLGESAVMVQLRARILQLAPLEIPVLIQGPTGAGKELVAHALHAASGRSGRFVPVNVCAIGDGMVEDALFGHARGAFTGALSDRDGYLAEADGGTLLLDEIGDLAPAVQTKLLRVLETGQFRPVGARSDRQSHFRLLAATNAALDEAVRDGAFRLDLYHRLRGVVMRVPALRERVDDVPLLAAHYLAQAAMAQQRNLRFGLGAMTMLQGYAWPGNVRELRNVITCAAALTPEEVIATEQLLELLHASGDGAERRDVGDSWEPHRQALAAVLERHQWDAVAAARELGISKTTIYRRMGAYGVRRPPDVARQRPRAEREGDQRSPENTSRGNSHTVNGTLRNIRLVGEA